ncbi:MAG: hypothetical protein IPL26_11155 [Leptospiraceae bacterium]|nr:hypothetical protein [Leptospiraceae bacterium]
MLLTEDEVELYQNQRNLALSTIDDLTDLKIQLLESGFPVPQFINNSIHYLKKKYLIQDHTIGQALRTHAG